jgi:hypothetical protein
MNAGLKIADSGFNVLTAQSHQLAYSTQFDTFKLYRQGAGAAACQPATVNTVTIDHQLGYRPAFLVFSEISPDFGAAGEYHLLPFLYPIGGDISIVPYISKTQLKIRYGADQSPNPINLNYRYFIFYNRCIVPSRG